jgi:hypothetical protein
VTNVDGSATSSAAVLTVEVPTGAPSISAQPAGGQLPASGGLALSVSASGGALTYQWYLNGAAISGATSSSYTATTAGNYTVAITNSIATTTSTVAAVTYSSRLINISTRADVQTGGGIAIAGFVIEGPAGSTKQLLIRGDGPVLGSFGVSDILAQPLLVVVDANQKVVASNTVWGTYTSPTSLQSIAQQVGAFALPVGSNDSALVANLGPGSYTVDLSGVGSTTGVGLVEVYEVNTSEVPVLVNISTRAYVGTGSEILIAGFVVTGSQPAQVLVRAVGPSLGNYGVTGLLAQPSLNLTTASGTTVASNTGWGNQTNASQVASTAASVGAFPLTSGSADSALVVTLQPGAYTAQVSGVGGSTGIALVEVYQVEP